MRKIFSRYSYLLLLAAIFMVGFFVIFTISKTPGVKAAAGDIVIVVNDELGTSLTGATVSATVACTGGANFTAVDGGANDDDSAVNGVIVFAAVNIGDSTTAECDNGEAFTTDIVAKDGYVTEDTSLTTYSTGAQNDATTTLDFSHKIIVKDELNTALTPTSATAGANNTACTVVLNSVYCPVPLADDNTVTDGFAVVKDGYVTSDVDLASNRTAATDAQALVTMDATNGLDFSHKVVIKNELNAALTPDTAAAGASLTGCTISTNNAYCPVPLADDNTVANGFVIIKDGYVTTTASDVPLAGNRTAGTNAQQVTTMTGTNGLDFSHKFLVKDELGTALTVTSATAGSASVACTISTSTAYCPVLLAQDNTLTNGLVAAKDGYVTTTAADVPLASNRTAGTDAQGVTTMSTSNGLDFAAKVTVTDSSTNAALSGGTVVLGDSFGVTCTEDGTTGVFYCIAPLADTATDVRSTRNNYHVKNGTYADRTAATDAQTTISLAMAPFVDPGGGSGGLSGQGSSGGATGYAVVTPPPANQENVQPAAPAPVTPAPIILKIETKLAAKADESRALTNFKLLYKRSANLKNAADRDAINIMANGVIKNLKRDLKAEQKALVKFRNTFGFLPKIARHWNIIRAIAYSGVTK